MWMVLLKDYDITIQYHQGKDYGVAGTLNPETMNMGSLTCLGVSKQPLSKEIQTLEPKFILLGISDKSGELASIDVSPTFMEEIKSKQFEDESQNDLRKKIVSRKAQDAILDTSGVINFREFFLRVDDFIQMMLTQYMVRGIPLFRV